MDDIARAAGMSRAAVYQYMRNKEDAFRRLAQRLLEEAPRPRCRTAGRQRPLVRRDDRCYNAAMRDLLAGAVSTARPGVEAVAFAELLLALTRGLEADLADPEAPARRLRHGVSLLVAGLNHPPTNTQESP